MTAKKADAPDGARKRKRIVPTRAAGTPAFDVVDDLFATAFANRKRIDSASLPENAENSGQPVNQNPVNRLTTVDNQQGEIMDNRLTENLVDRLSNEAARSVDRLSGEKLFRSRRERKLKGIRLPVQKLEKWELWCFINKYEFQNAVEIAMDWLTSQPNAMLTGQLDNHVLIDDLDDTKETDEIIIFYQKWTKNKVKPKDRAARESVNRFSIDICKIGILTAISRASKKINSFAYCVPVIEEIAEDAEVLKDKDGYLASIERFITRARKS